MDAIVFIDPIVGLPVTTGDLRTEAEMLRQQIDLGLRCGLEDGYPLLASFRDRLARLRTMIADAERQPVEVSL